MGTPGGFHPQSTAAALTGPSADSNGAAHGDGEAEFDESLVVDAADSDNSTSTKGSNRKPPVMNFVNDLDLHPTDKQSLKDFMAEKKPAKQWQQITLCVYYLCRVLEMTGITPHYVYTCLKDINAKVPKDLPQYIRTVANRKGHIDASNGDDLKITQPGINYVEHEMAAAGAQQ